MNTYQTISSKEAYSQREGALFLDVRTPAEYQEMHIDGSTLHPLSDLNPTRVQEFFHGKNQVILVCRSGGRARQACEKLVASGMTNLKVLEGGVTAWEASGLPVVRGKKTISLERQVRIAAGALVVLGAVLAFYVHPVFVALSGFVGAGLIFAGITDTCGMGMLLARMPWNARCSSDNTGRCIPQQPGNSCSMR